MFIQNIKQNKKNCEFNDFSINFIKQNNTFLFYVIQLKKSSVFLYRTLFFKIKAFKSGSMNSRWKCRVTNKLKQIILFSLYLFCVLPKTFSQRYFQQIVNYTIDVTLHDKSHEL